MKLNINYLLIIVFLASGCQASLVKENINTSNTALLRSELETLHINDPDQDMRKKMEKNDFRFVCICGFICYTPSVEKDNLKLVKIYGRRCLEGTSDGIDSEEHGKLIGVAIDYADKYNSLLLKELKKDPNKAMEMNAE